VDLFMHSPIHLYVVVLNLVSVGTTLPHHEVVWGSRDIVPSFLTLSISQGEC
jgi:hypothetical protein